MLTYCLLHHLSFLRKKHKIMTHVEHDGCWAREKSMVTMSHSSIFLNIHIIFFILILYWYKYFVSLLHLRTQTIFYYFLSNSHTNTLMNASGQHMHTGEPPLDGLLLLLSHRMVMILIILMCYTVLKYLKNVTKSSTEDKERVCF